MTKKDILQKAIEKAKQKGFKLPYIKLEYSVYDRYQSLICLYETEKDYSWYGFKDIIFSHDFAKAFWGEEEHNWNGTSQCSRCRYYSEWGEDHSYCWEYHLQQMVLEKEPLKYLERFL